MDEADEYLPTQFSLGIPRVSVWRSQNVSALFFFFSRVVAGHASSRGDVLMACMAVVARAYTPASLQYRDGARRAFTDQAAIACTKGWGGIKCIF